MAKVFVPKERSTAETRVAATPETVKKYVKQGLDVEVESGAGVEASFSDDDYRKAGATVVDASHEPADVVLVVAPPQPEDTAVTRLGSGSLLLGFLDPFNRGDLLDAVRGRGAADVRLECCVSLAAGKMLDHPVVAAL